MQTALCKLLGIDVPIIQAPMAGAVGPAIAAAVSNAGGLGMLVLWRADLETVRRQIRETRSLTRRPFGVNLNLEFPQDGRGLAAVLALGASGAWIGPRFLASHEAAIHPRYRERLLKATEDETVFLEELFDVGWPRTPHRVLRNKTVAAWETAGRPPSGKRPGEGEGVATSKTSGRIVRYQSYTPGADAEGGIEALLLWAGQSGGLVSRMQSACEIVRESVEEAPAILGKLSS